VQVGTCPIAILLASVPVLLSRRALAAFGAAGATTLPGRTVEHGSAGVRGAWVRRAVHICDPQAVAQAARHPACATRLSSTTRSSLPTISHRPVPSPLSLFFDELSAVCAPHYISPHPVRTLLVSYLSPSPSRSSWATWR